MTSHRGEINLLDDEGRHFGLREAGGVSKTGDLCKSKRQMRATGDQLETALGRGKEASAHGLPSEQAQRSGHLLTPLPYRNPSSFSFPSVTSLFFV